jgi:tryptophan synthase alpha chain
MTAHPTPQPAGGARIERAIRARREGGRPALAAFLTAGYPDRGRFLALLPAVAAIADLVEVGVPFSDPMADGLTIQRASRVALASGTTLRWILDALGKLAPRPQAPLVLMSYLNPLLAFGLGPLAAAAARAGVSAVIIPDLPLEESDAVRAALASADEALVGMVTPVTPPERLRAIGAASQGFTYAVTMTGTTGGTAAALDGLAAYLERARAASAVPLLAGFGIRGADQVAALAAHVDGFIVGSALIEEIEAGRDPAAFLAVLTGRAVPDPARDAPAGPAAGPKEEPR